MALQSIHNLASKQTLKNDFAFSGVAGTWINDPAGRVTVWV